MRNRVYVLVCIPEHPVPPGLGLCRILHLNFRELRYGEVRRILLKRTSEKPQKAKFAEYLF
jgi:hypothetical protein